MPPIKEPKKLLETVYFKKGIIGNIGTPGASIINFSLVIWEEESKVSGIVEISRSINKPSFKLNVVGTIRNAGYGKITKIINLKGEYIVFATPPAIGSYLKQFTAYLDVSSEWKGTGGFTYGNREFFNVNVTAVH